MLRYPRPASPNGPSTFVDDALYLRQHITQGGGSHIIEKYADKSFSKGKRTKTPKSQASKRIETPNKTRSSKSQSPNLSPSRFLQEKGGIDAIIQEAAKGVYSRGEKWGVNRALRGAVEGLQSGTDYSRKQLDGSRWSLDEGTHLPSVSNLTADLRSLEERSKGLGKLLENAIGELWVQQRQHSNEKEEGAANALSLAIAKVQFVQVYLENPTMPFTVENSESKMVPTQGHEDAVDEVPGIEPRPTVSSSPEGRLNTDQSASKDPEISENSPEGQSASLTDPVPDITVSKVRPQPLPFHRPRPSLAQSSFSWMLGEDQRKSSFVSPTPFPSDRRAAREKADFLFGDGKLESESKTRKGRGPDEGEDEEVINLGTLKGRD